LSDGSMGPRCWIDCDSAPTDASQQYCCREPDTYSCDRTDPYCFGITCS
jgi:hypothetical protein